MSQAVNIAFDQSFLMQAVTNLLIGKNLYLGVILDGNQVATGSPLSTALSAEYNGAGWTRPSVVLTSEGSYNATTNKWGIPDTTQWSIVAPTGGFSIRQLFVIVGGSATPRDATGLFMGVSAPYSIALSVDSGATQPIIAPWTLYGAS